MSDISVRRAAHGAAVAQAPQQLKYSASSLLKPTSSLLHTYLEGVGELTNSLNLVALPALHSAVASGYKSPSGALAS